MRPAICIQTFTLLDQIGIKPGIALVKVPERTLTSNRRGHLLRAGAGMLQRYLWKLLPKQRRPLPARDFCTQRTRRLVRRVYARDYEMLGYE